MGKIIHDFDKIVQRRGTDAKKYDPRLYPEDVLPMWIADTDFECPKPIVDKIVARGLHGIYGYSYNDDEFGLATKNWMKKRFNWEIDSDWVEFVPGVIPGIIYALRVFSNPGDKVIIQTPAYPPFSALVTNNGRTLLENPLILKDGKYYIDFEDLEEKLKDNRTKIMILCNPQNPSGRVFTLDELKKIGELCLKYNVFIISDEIHCDLVYKGYKHIPFASISEEFAMNSMTCINPSKTFNIAGLRTAAIIIPDKYKKEQVYESIVNNKAYGRNIFGTIAFETAYNECEYYVEQLMEYLEKNRQICIDYFQEKIPKVKLIKPEATYLFWLDCRELGFNEKELDDFMFNEAKVGLNSGYTFGSDGKGFMRLNIACPREILIEGLERIKKAVNNI